MKNGLQEKGLDEGKKGLFTGVDDGKKSELLSRAMQMKLSGLKLNQIGGIMEDIIEGDLPREITDDGKGNNDMRLIEEFMMKSPENKDFVEKLIFSAHSSEEIVEIIKIDDTTEVKDKNQTVN